jgi:hypothetical protein
MSSAKRTSAQSATIRVRAPSGALRTFYAEQCEIRDGLVTAEGRWRADCQIRAYTWPRRQLVEIRWCEAVAA